MAEGRGRSDCLTVHLGASFTGAPLASDLAPSHGALVFKSVAQPRTSRRHPWRWRIVGIISASLLLLLIAGRLALPYGIRWYVNRTIDQSPLYAGRIGDIDVHLWRGAYSIHDLRIVKRTG